MYSWMHGVAMCSAQMMWFIQMVALHYVCDTHATFFIKSAGLHDPQLTADDSSQHFYPLSLL